MFCLFPEVINRIARHYPGRWMQGYVRGKLGSDPIFAAAYDLLKDAPLPVLDVGCGVGLFEFYLRERGYSAPLTGLDFDTEKIARAQAISSASYPDIHFSVGDAFATVPFSGHIVLFDVLHYLPAERQRPLLEHLANRVAPGGLCLIRATPRDEGWRFRVTQAQEVLLRASRWMKSSARHYGRVEDIVAPFRERNFTCGFRPLWARTPFNSHFFIFRAPEIMAAVPNVLANSELTAP